MKFLSNIFANSIIIITGHLQSRSYNTNATNYWFVIPYHHYHPHLPHPLKIYLVPYPLSNISFRLSTYIIKSWSSQGHTWRGSTAALPPSRSWTDRGGSSQDAVGLPELGSANLQGQSQHERRSLLRGQERKVEKEGRVMARGKGSSLNSCKKGNRIKCGLSGLFACI